DYERLWLTTSLRGMVGGTLKIEVLRQGMHSGSASGVVPSPFMILRQLLDRIENAKNSEILLDALKVEIPKHHITQAQESSPCLLKNFSDTYSFLPGVKAVSDDH